MLCWQVGNNYGLCARRLFPSSCSSSLKWVYDRIPARVQRIPKACRGDALKVSGANRWRLKWSEWSRKSHLVEWQRVLEDQVSSNQSDAEFEMAKHVVAEDESQERTTKSSYLREYSISATRPQTFSSRETCSRKTFGLKTMSTCPLNPKRPSWPLPPLPCEDTSRLRCFQWSSRWTGWPGTPPHRRTTLSTERQQCRYLRDGIFFVKGSSLCVGGGLNLTSAGRDQGPNIPPSPVNGSNRGTIQSRNPDDRGAWQDR